MRKIKSKHIARNRLVIALRKAERDKAFTPRDGKCLTRLLVALGATLILTSCGGIHTSFCYGAGCKAPADLATGIIAETKMPAGKKSAYWQSREAETNRLTWMEAIFANGGQQ